LDELPKAIGEKFQKKSSNFVKILTSYASTEFIHTFWWMTAFAESFYGGVLISVEIPPLCVDALFNLIRDGRVKNLYDMEECFIYCDLKWSRLLPSVRESTAQFSFHNFLLSFDSFEHSRSFGGVKYKKSIRPNTEIFNNFL